MFCIRIYRTHRISRILLWLLLAALTSLNVFGIANFEQFERLASSQYGANANSLAVEFTRLLVNLSDADTDTKLKMVNDFFNDNIQFRDDISLWGENDYWASPLETIGKGAGDCEDFTIAKFVALRLLGIPLDKLRLTYVKARIGAASSKISQAHMVLSYYESPAATPLILDNLYPNIRPASQRPDLTPVFGFNSERLWVGNAAQASSYDPKSRLSRWQKTLAKIHDEGLD
ncbi:transglutaminase-like cysteine peptidase [Zhongshania sp. BJYM1]|uniref:transglutaminase-like cysteine peptidase n=1 Tax=Zhongshania aquatica TaxID=2965069 RepID=UPI0022B3B08C|nr:transglutaminase-like cysteine peptidase [Marortus sp. BJYM1]